MVRRHTLIAWLALLLAGLAWGAVAWFTLAIQQLENDHATSSRQQQHQSDQVSQATYLHALVSDTSDERAHLDSISNVDLAGLADMINTAGKSAGVNIQISDASQQSVATLDSKTSAQTFSFLATSEGSFASVMHTLQLLEKLPMPSSVQAIEIVHAPATPGSTSAGASWRMNAQIRILSVTPIAS